MGRDFKHVVLLWIFQCLEKFGLLSVLLFIADYCEVKRLDCGDGKVIFPYIRKRKDFHFLILVGHRVNDSPDPFIGGIHPGVFKRQLETLSKSFQILPLKEVLLRAQQSDLPPNALAITFDDGYRDNYEQAYPILRALGVPATIFLSTGPLESEQEPLWHDLVFDAFRRTEAPTVAIGDRTYSLKTLQERRQALWVFRQFLRGFEFCDWKGLIARLRVDLGFSKDWSCPGFEKLEWWHIKEMAQQQISIGVHTVSHPLLTCLPISEAIQEIKISKAAIEKNLGLAADLFAYPNGNRKDFNETIKEVLRDEGFLCGVTTIQGTNCVHTDRFELRRLGLSSDHHNIAPLRLGWNKFCLSRA